MVTNLNANYLGGNASSAFLLTGASSTFLPTSASSTFLPTSASSGFLPVGASHSITLGGDLSGSVTVSNSASGSYTLNASIGLNSVALGTDTTGDYVAAITGASNGIVVTTTGGEGASVGLALPQALHTTASPSFSQVISTASGTTPPFQVASTASVTNLNADLLDGQHGAYWSDCINVSNKPSLTLPVTLSGDVGGSGSVTLTSLGSGTVSISNTTIGSNTVALGTDTVGDYVAAVTGASNGIVVTTTGGEGASVGLALPQALHTTASPTFSSLTLGATSGPPLTVTSQSLVANLNAELVGGQNLTNLDTRFVNASGDFINTGGSLTFSGTGQKVNLFDANYGAGVQTNTTYLRTAQNFALYAGGTHNDGELNAGGGTELLKVGNTSNLFNYKSQKVWHEGNDGASSGLDADLLDGVQGSEYASRALLESVLGDLMYVGLYNASAYTNSPAFYLPNPTAVNNNYLSLPAATRGTDSSMDFRVDCDRPNDAVITRRPFQWGYYFVFNPDGSFTGNIYDTLATFPGVVATKAQLDAIAIQGTRIQMRLLWNAATDQLTIYARAYTGLALTDDTGWTQINQATLTGKILISTSITPLIGSGDGPQPFNGNIYGVAGWVWGATGNTQTAYVNGSPTYKVLPTDVGNIPSVTSFTCSTGQTVTVNRAAVAPQTTLPTQKPVPSWAGTNTTYRHGMYWIASSPGKLDFVDTDLSGRQEIGVDDQAQIFNGDWIVALNPTNSAASPNVNLTLSQVVFQMLPFSTETFIKQRIELHATDPTDVHSAAGYLLRNPAVALSTIAVSARSLSSNVATVTTSVAHGFLVGSKVVVAGLGAAFDGARSILSTSASAFTYLSVNADVVSASATGTVGPQDSNRLVDDVFSKIGHVHTQDITTAILAHVAATDPHTQYLSKSAASIAYAPFTHDHDGRYEPVGSVAAHVAGTDPHPQYLTSLEGDNTYSPLAHSTRDDHDGRYSQIGHVHDFPIEVKATDGALSARVWIGNVDPQTLGVRTGDIWIEAASVTPSAPVAPTSFTATSPSGSQVLLTWPVWPTDSSAYTSVTLDFSTDNVNWTNIAGITTSQVAYTHTGRTTRVLYYYRLRATNTVGVGAYGFTSINAANDAPVAPGSLVASAISATSITLSWAAPSPFTYPASPNLYEVFKNGVFASSASVATYTFTGLSENTTYSLSVKAIDNRGLRSAEATLPSTTINAVPPNVSGLSVTTQSVNSVVASWSSVAGISDLLNYQVKIYPTASVGSASTSTTTNLTKTFTGLAYSTGYTVEVKAVDTGSLLSSAAATGTTSTGANPDTTPPANVTLTSFKPEDSYGKMVVRWTYPADADLNSITIQRSLDNANWVTDTVISALGLEGTSPSAGWPLNSSVGYAPNTTVYVRIIATDDTGNSTPSPAVLSYTLVASPAFIPADSTNSWRSTNGGEYNSQANLRPYQGYFSNAAYNAIGIWYYGTRPADLYNSGRRTITQLRVFLIRWDAGAGGAQTATIYPHGDTSNPGTVSGRSSPALLATGQAATSTAITSPLGGTAAQSWTTVPAVWGTNMLNGTYRGVAVYSFGGTPYMNFANVTDNGYTGLLEFTHLG